MREYDFDFEHVSGFEPKVLSPYSAVETTNDRQCDDSIYQIRARLDCQDELPQKLVETHYTTEAASKDEPQTLRFVKSLREYSRVPVPEKWTNAEFRIDGRKYSCEIVELSLGGFGIRLPRGQNIQPGTLGQLCAPGLNYIVSVTRIDPKAEGHFVGLKQIEEVIGNDPIHPHADATKVSYLIAGLAGTLIAAICCFFMQAQ